MVLREIGDSLKKLDLFGASVPSFRLNKKDKVHSCVGGCLTLMLFSITLLFALVKFEHLMLHKNPSIV